MRHHRAAAGWSSGRGPAATADRTRRAASKLAPVSLLNFCQLGQEWVCRGARGFCGEQLPPLPIWVVSRGGESLAELLLPASGGGAEPAWPSGSRVAGVDLGGGAPYLHVRDQFGWHESVELGRPGRRFTCGC
jgi:hypothetical protein